jgi:hypothetical protein
MDDDDAFDFTEDELKQLEELRRQRGEKFDEICTYFADRLGDEVDPAQIRDEAEEATRQWDEDVASSGDPKQLDKAAAPEPGVQQLLAEHHRLGELILDIQDEATERNIRKSSRHP